MGCGDLKNLLRRTTSDKVLQNKAFYIAKSPKSDEYQRGIASIVHKPFDKKSSAMCANKFSPHAGTEIKFKF